MKTSAIRKKIRDKREEKGITQEEMADRMHIDRRTYTRIESGEKKFLDVNLLEKLAKELDMDITELLTEDNGVNIETINNTDTRGIAGSVYTNDVIFNQTDERLIVVLEKTLEELKLVIQEKNTTIETLRDVISTLQKSGK